MSTTSRRNNEIFQKANKYCIAALISLSIALAVLSVGVFLTYPISVVGFLSTCIGIVCTLLSILFFALYSHYLRQQKQLNSRCLLYLNNYFTFPCRIFDNRRLWFGDNRY